MEILKGIIPVALIILLGFLMLKAASWSRKRNYTMRLSGKDSQDEIIEKALKEGGLKSAVKDYLASSVSKKDEFKGKLLAVAVVLVVIGFFVLVAYLGI